MGVYCVLWEVRWIGLLRVMGGVWMEGGEVLNMKSCEFMSLWV